MRFVLSALFFLTSFLASSAFAQDYNTLLDIPEGATLVNLSATERVEVDQDLLIATLRYEAENKDPKALQDEINTVMQKAVEAAKKIKDVKVTTQQYSVYPYDYDPDPQPLKHGETPHKLMRTWRGQQGLMLKSKNAAELLDLVGALQGMKLAMEGLDYTVSPELLEETRKNLLESALKKLKSKAERTAAALGKTKTNLLQINVDIGGYSPQPMMYGKAMAPMAVREQAMAAPVAEAGQSDITLTVNAQALLKP